MHGEESQALPIGGHDHGGPCGSHPWGRAHVRPCTVPLEQLLWRLVIAGVWGPYEEGQRTIRADGAGERERWNRSSYMSAKLSTLESEVT